MLGTLENYLCSFARKRNKLEATMSLYFSNNLLFYKTEKYQNEKSISNLEFFDHEVFQY
jgi:hypothetical protein